MLTNLYTLLKLESNASQDKIQEAIYREQRIWSNRTNAPSIQKKQEAESMVAMLDEAEAILLDPDRRRAYDEELANSGGSPARSDPTLTDSDDLVSTGWELLIAGDVANALYVATQATTRDGGDPEAWALLGQAKFRWGDLEDALYEYRRAITLKPNESSYYFDLGSIYESMENWQEALQQYKRAAKIDPNSAMYQAAIGILFLKNDLFQEGIDILEKCVQAEPDNDTFRTYLALSYCERAYEFWTWVPSDNSAGLSPGYYATDKQQVLAAHDMITKAIALEVDDGEVASHVRSVSQNIESMLVRKFHGSYASPIVGGLLWLSVFGLGLVLAPLYFYVSRPPQYAINKSIIGGFRSADEDAFVEGFGSGLVMLVITGLFLPAMVIWNFVKYNTGKNSTSDIELLPTDDLEKQKVAELTPEQVRERLDTYLPAIKKHVQDLPAKAGQSIQQYGVEKLLEDVHALLPLPVRLVVRKQRFIKFCMNHQELIFGEQLIA